MNDADLVQRALRLATMAIYWAKGSVKVAINTRDPNLAALHQKMQDIVRSRWRIAEPRTHGTEA